MEEVCIVTRDINGKRIDHHLLWDQVYVYVDDHLTDEDEILMVVVEGLCVYSSLASDPITREELIGFFA